MTESGLHAHTRACGGPWPAHARSGDRLAIAADLGKSAAFGRAIVEFSHAYTEQDERDYNALAAAISSGRITAETGL